MQRETISTVGMQRPSQGGTEPSHHLLKAYELLQDGKWHDYHPVLTAVAAMVHPALAYRVVIRRRVTVPKDEAERAATVRTGQREISRDTLNRKERFERRVLRDGTKQIRMLPFRERTPEDYSRASKKGWASNTRKKV